MTIDDDLDLAHELASAASSIALQYFAGQVHAEIKADGSPVTEADLAVETRLVELLREHRPDDGVVSEEAGEVVSGSRRWLLDPIDGTVHFLAGGDDWGTHIALEEGGRIILGVLTRPVRHTRWWAAAGRGAHRRNDSAAEPDVRLLIAHQQREVRGARVGVFEYPGTELSGRLADAGAEVRLVGSHVPDLIDGALDAVVAGRGCGFAWDHAPAVVLTHEAGGTFIDPEGGRRHDLRGGVYANASLAAGLLPFL